MMVKLKTNVVVLLFVEQAGLLQFVAFFVCLLSLLICCVLGGGMAWTVLLVLQVC